MASKIPQTEADVIAELREGRWAPYSEGPQALRERAKEMREHASRLEASADEDERIMALYASVAEKLERAIA